MNVNDFKEKLAPYREGLAEGLSRGLDQGLDLGFARGLRVAIADLCEVFGIEMTVSRRVHLATLDLEGLKALRQHLKQQRSWPG